MNKSTILFPQSVSREEFKDYCAGPFSQVLELLSLPMAKTSLKYKQAAARALGFSCYESLVARWTRADHIRDGMVMELCDVQHGRLTVKAKNILCVFDASLNTFFVMPLRPGEEGRSVDYALCDVDDEMASIDLPENAVLCAQQSKKSFAQSVANALDDQSDTVRASIFYESQGEPSLRGRVEFCRTDEGIIIDVYAPDDEYVCNSVGVMFSDRQLSEGSEALVDLAGQRAEYGGELGVHYRWMKADVDSDGSSRLLHIAPEEEHDISDLLFSSPEQAVEAVESETWGVDPDGMREEGAVLVKTTLSVVPSPY